MLAIIRERSPMRRTLKKDVMEVFKSLHEAHGVVEGFIDGGQADKAAELLTECQNTAVQIGDIITESEGGRAAAIPLLEKYCEAVYHTAVDIAGGLTGERARRLLDKKLSAAEESAEKIPAPVRIAFFPYNASMWTAFESIWRAATDSGLCEVKVVPVPYCELDSDGKPGKWHWDGERFPKQVKITRYDEYDIEKEQPDISFIHNGYDDGNTLTNIHPAFYSERLKSCSGRLVYSPYSTIGGFTPGKSDAMFINKGTQAADKIVVQSAFTADIYRGYGYEKSRLIVQGSPKTDAVISKCSGSFDRDAQMPEEWKEKLAGKEKIFLLNTHWSYFLAGARYQAQGYFDFAQKYHNQFFNVMKKFGGRCGMIWRPHPLMITALRQRAPQLLEYVQGYIDRIAKSDFAVVDTGGDYSDAFRCSDAMVTTYSSLINEYLVTEKPVLIFQSKPTPQGGARSPIDYGKCYFTFKKDNGMRYTQFVEMILRGEDPMKDERMAMLREKSFANMDGSVGRRIFDELMGEL